ncbi:MAG: hypothetical protein U0821_09525 [Chloroflexota bacterium]
MIGDWEKPEIDFLIVADRVEAVNGRLYMMGGAIDTFNVIDFARPVGISLALGILVPWNAANEDHAFNVSVESEDGSKIEPDISGNLNVGRPSTAIRGQSFRALIAINAAWTLPGPGTYRVMANVAGAQPKREVFHAVKAPPR